MNYDLPEFDLPEHIQQLLWQIHDRATRGMRDLLHAKSVAEQTGLAELDAMLRLKRGCRR